MTNKPTIRDILHAAAHGSFAHVDGVGRVFEQMFADLLDMEEKQRQFLEKYGHIVRAIEAPPVQPRPLDVAQGYEPARTQAEFAQSFQRLADDLPRYIRQPQPQPVRR